MKVEYITKIILSAILLIHGLIHLMGFAKAFGYSEMPQISEHIGKPEGMLWLVVTLLFSLSTILYLTGNRNWWLFCGVAVVISQILIFNNWQSAKYGTIANLIILIPVIAHFGMWNFENKFINDYEANEKRVALQKSDILSENDIKHLPAPVQKYLHYTEVVGKEKVKSVRIVFEGQMREKGKDWFSFRSEQYNFFDNPTRLFFMKGEMFGLTVPGYHKYSKGKAYMDVRLFGFFTVMGAEGDIMNKAETVTLFNDMCLMAPASLIDGRIKWEETDSLSTKATFTNGNITISATLYFNSEGQLTNFVSDDRYAISDMKSYRFSTPVQEYKKINGVNVLSRGEAVWHYPDGEFTYGVFNLSEIEFNPGIK
ncbi:MAG: hypothetical protein LCH52_06055 [Bacteroidetes bacterium]|nr:hypothetical protein [Bacteroidota bacterium]